MVYRNEINAELQYSDERTWEQACMDTYNLLQPVFKDGIMLKEQTLSEIRHILYRGDF